MKFPVSWLLEYAPVAWDENELAERLTMSGSEVEHLRDGVMEIKVTPNRGDTLSMIGMAREVSALSGVPVRIPEKALNEDDTPAETLASVRIDAPDLCPRYAARIIRGVRIGPSPRWMVEKLESAGLRSINNVVDVTNFVLLEYGQPLHAFDYDLLKDHSIIVRRANPGETITTIDGGERALEPEMLVIADTGRAVAVAGVMGGAESEISEGTVNVLLESAHFNPVSIRRTAKALGMSTDSSYRFERHVDPSGVVDAADRAASLIAELAGGTVARGVIDVYPTRYEPRPLSLRPERCNLLNGTDFSVEEMIDALAGLDFQPAGTDPIRVMVPTWRTDIVREDDLAEEVARIVGYDRIPCANPRGENLRGGLDAEGLFRSRLHTLSLQAGLQEAMTSTLVDDEFCITLGYRPTAILSNPLSREVNACRPSLVPGLVDVCRRNSRLGRAGLGFFELGRVQRLENGIPREDVRWAVALLADGKAGWLASVDAGVFLQAKGILEAVAGCVRVPELTFAAVQREGFHPGRCAGVSVNGKEIGILGEIHPEVAESLDVPQGLCVFEIDVETLRSVCAEPRYRQTARFPAISRDIAFVLPRTVTQAKVVDVIRSAGGPLLRDVSLFDVFRGERLGADAQSLAYRLTWRDDERTLEDSVANEALENVRQALVEKLGASFR